MDWVLLGDYHDSGSLFFNVWGKYTRPFVISADKVGKYSRDKVVLTGTDAYLSEVEMLGYKDNGILKSDLKNAIDVAKSIDTTGEFALICDFETMDDLNTYQVHPAHVAFGQFIKPLREARACIDYEY